ncbi:MAG TPA: hypothetical protein DCS93_24735 [Microscillaceae bacterium]|nr:hypothetical protein [Microscillaceae bacterium]
MGGNNLVKTYIKNKKRPNSIDKNLFEINESSKIVFFEMKNIQAITNTTLLVNWYSFLFFFPSKASKSL